MDHWVVEGASHVVIRRFGAEGDGVRLACGYHCKPSPRQGYIDRPLSPYVMVYLLRGSGWFTGSDGERRRVSAGDVLQHMPGYPHSLEPDADGRWWEFWFDLPVGLATGLSDLGMLRADPVIRVGLSPTLRVLCDRLLKAEEGGTGDDHGASVVAAAVELTLALHGPALAGGRGTGSPDGALIQQLDTARRWLDADPASDEPIPRLAARLGLAYDVFRKGFRKRVGVSPHAYRIRRRLELGHHLMTREGLSVSETAERLGYPDAFCFSKQYKRVRGVPPSRADREASGVVSTAGVAGSVA
ncbi:MAG: AraC family transcriptional regulator [Planctomycetota bacterium]